MPDNTISFSIYGKAVVVVGGPYRDRPKHMFGVNMAQELRELPADVYIPTQDFSVPGKDVLLVGLEKTLDAILQGKTVYVGCMGGIGRTGLFLSVLTKFFYPRINPVFYVREQYYAGAVETKTQMDYIYYLNILPVRLKYKTKFFLYKLRRKGIFAR